MSHLRHKAGFTLIELLVVIAIIGLLASVAFVSLDNARKKSKATKIVQDFKQIEKALYLLKDKENPARWWRESDKGGGPLTDFAGLSEFIKITNPPIPGSYHYDGDGDILVDGNCCAGVNVFVYCTGNCDTNYVNMLDNIIDKGDGYVAGKLRFNSSNALIYNISPDENIN